jgi:putative membrane protein
MMYWYGHGMSSWGYGLMAISMLLFWGLVIAAGTMFLRQYLGAQPAAFAQRTPEQVLVGGFARGDITHEDFVRHQDALHAQEASQQAPKTAR